MQHKTFDLIEIKADGQQGEFTALASVFNNVDLGGDRMLPGSFKNTLEKWRSTGDPIPVVLSHQWDDPMAYVGKADPRAVYETDEGLVVQGQLDTSTDVGAQVYKLMKDRLLKGWSFGYTVPKGGQKRQKDGTNDVSEVDLVEVGPTLKGMNPEAQLQAIKSVDTEKKEMGPAEMATKLVSIAETLGEHPDAAASLQEMAAQIKTSAEESAKNQAIEDAVDEEPSEAKSQAQDPLSQSHDELAFELTTAGIDMTEPPQVKSTEPESDPPTLAELERQFHDLMLETLS